MSRSIDVFIDCDDRATLVAAVAEAVGQTPIEVGDDRWQIDLGSGDVATLGRHDFVDDGDLPFTRYPWDLWARVPHEGPLLGHPAAEALRTAGERLRRAGLRALTVVDLQYRLDSAATAPGPASAGAADAAPAEP